MSPYSLPQLNDKQLNRLSEFSSNLAILTIATFVLPNLFGVDKLSREDLQLGLSLTVGLLVSSMFLIKK